MTQFKVGDMVQLKSGGPKMTVARTDFSGTITINCQWFSGGKLNSGFFDPASLVLIVDDDQKKT